MDIDKFKTSDMGSCEFRLGTIENKIFIEFDHPMEWIGIEPSMAIDLAQKLIRMAQRCGYNKVVTIEIGE